MTPIGRIIRAVALACVVAGCSLSIETVSAPQNACVLARVGGILKWDATVGLGLGGPDAPTRRVIWPFGYSARWEAGGVALISPGGTIIAREGDRIVSAGFTGEDGTAHPCGSITVER